MDALSAFVSLTTISSRIKTIGSVLQSLLNQSRRPDKIILNISSEPFMLDQGIGFRDLPEPVREICMGGHVELYRVANHGSYRKLIPTLRRYKGLNFLVATADDDVVYPPGWLAGLLDAYERHRCIVAYRCRTFAFGASGLLPYCRWPMATAGANVPLTDIPHTRKSLHLLPTGRGGIIYHSSHFPCLSLLERFRELAPGQDDLAFRWATMVRNIPVAVCDPKTNTTDTSEFPGFHYAENLYYINREGTSSLSVNDITWNRLAAYCVSNHIEREMARGLLIQCDG